MTSEHVGTEGERIRTKTLAAIAFVLAPLVLRIGFLRGVAAAYENIWFALLDVGIFIAVLLTAVPVTAFLYG